MLANAEKYLFWGSNPEWYDYDENDKPYLTDKAPEKAKQSFEEYLKVIEKQKDTNVKII